MCLCLIGQHADVLCSVKEVSGILLTLVCNRGQYQSTFTHELMLGPRWPRGRVCVPSQISGWNVWFWNFPRSFIHSWVQREFLNTLTDRNTKTFFFYNTCGEVRKILTPPSYKRWIGHPCLWSLVLVDVLLIPKLNPYSLKWTHAWKLKYGPAVFDCFTQTIK